MSKRLKKGHPIVKPEVQDDVVDDVGNHAKQEEPGGCASSSVTDPYMALPVDSSDAEHTRVAQWCIERLTELATGAGQADDDEPQDHADEQQADDHAPQDHADEQQADEPVVTVNKRKSQTDQPGDDDDDDDTEGPSPEDPREAAWYKLKDAEEGETYPPLAGKVFMDAPWRNPDYARTQASSSSGPPPEKSRCGFPIRQSRGGTCQDYAAWQCTAQRCKKHCPDPDTCTSHSVQSDKSRSVNRNPGRGFLKRMQEKGLQPPPYKHWNQWRTDR